MKIALLSPFFQPIAEPFVGGTEASVARLALGLKKQGIDVVCYACEGSYLSGVEIRTCGVPRSALAYPRAPQELSGDVVLDIRAYEDAVMYQVIEDACNDSSIDIIHNNSFSAVPLFISHLIQKPIMHTLRLPPMLSNMVEALRFCRRQDILLNLIGISGSQAQLWQPYYPVSKIIYNGMDFAAFPEANLSPESRLAFVGRMDPAKGLEDAIAVANQLGKELDIYGAAQNINSSYFETQIVPQIEAHKNIIYHGAVSHAEVLQGMSRAEALLFPVKWDEPFGNVIIEAMAVGTPVLMYDRGAARELITDTVNGFIIAPDDVQALASAVGQVARLDRAGCAEQARARFSLCTCVGQYIALAKSIING